MANETLERSNPALDNDELNSAILACTEVIRLDPQSAMAYCGRAYAYEQKGDSEKAIADYTEAIHLNPNDARAYYNRACIYGRRGDNEKAISDYTEAIRLNPNDAYAYYNRACTYGQRGDNEKAIADHAEAIRLNPELEEVCSDRGVKPPIGSLSDVERQAVFCCEKSKAKLKAEIAKRPVSLRLPHKGFRFRTLRDINVDVATYLRVAQNDLVVPIEIKQGVVSKGEVLRLDYEPIPTESTHCRLVPDRYEQLEMSLVDPQLRKDKGYSGYSFSVSYLQLDADFEWFTKQNNE